MAPSNGPSGKMQPTLHHNKHVVPLFNFTTGVHTNHLFELSQHLIEISYGVKILTYLAFYIDFKIYLILIKPKVDQIQLNPKKTKCPFLSL